MDVADVEPLLVHLLVRQEAVPGQKRLAPTLTVAQHSPVARALEQKDGIMGVGEVGGVDVAIWMVSALHGGENISDVFGEASRQAVGFHVERVHLCEQTVVVVALSVYHKHSNKSRRKWIGFDVMSVFFQNLTKQSKGVRCRLYDFDGNL